MNKFEEMVALIKKDTRVHYHIGDLMESELSNILEGWVKQEGIVHSVPSVGDLISAIIVDDKGDAIAVAQANVRNGKRAVIRGVWTDARYRGNGHGMTVCEALVTPAIKLGLQCTVYSNRNSRKIFSDLGFEFGKENRINVAFGVLNPPKE